MFPQHVSVALRVSRNISGWSYSVEESEETFQEMREGDPSEQVADVIANVIEHGGVERRIVILTRSKVLLSRAGIISGIFPHLTVMTPYDHATEALYRVAHENIDLIDFPAPPVREIASDASVSPTRAAWAWVSRTEEGVFEFDYGVCPVADATTAEALGIVNAATAQRLSTPVKILCDSKSAIRSVSDGLDAQDVPSVLRPIRLPNLRSMISQMNDRHAEGTLSLQWVKGHKGHHLNTLADQVATYVRRRIRTQCDDALLRAEVQNLVDSHTR